MTEAGMRRLIHSRKDELGTWDALAAELGYSTSYLHRVASDGSRVPDSIARKLGYRREDRVRFVALEASASD